MFVYFLTYLVLVPSAALCLFPMRNQLKYGLRLTVLDALALFSIVIPLISFMNYKFSFAPNLLLFLLFPVFFFAYYRSLCVHISKALAVFCSVVSLMSILGNFSACFDAMKNPNLGVDAYTLEYALSHFGLGVLAAALFFYPAWKYGSRMIDALESEKVWFLTVPFSVLILVMNLALRMKKYETFHVNNIPTVLPTVLTAFLITWILLHIIFYFIVTELLNASQNRERIRLLEMQESHVVAQQRYMEASAQARHDFRQAIRTLKNLAQEKDYAALEAFIDHYAESLPEQDVKTYCHNHALNALLNYYVHLAEQSQIRVKIKMRLPK